jgi:hypothetical protein
MLGDAWSVNSHAGCGVLPVRYLVHHGRQLGTSSSVLARRYTVPDIRSPAQDITSGAWVRRAHAYPDRYRRPQRQGSPSGRLLLFDEPD